MNKKILLPAFSIGILLLLWEISVYRLKIPKYILPAPTQIIIAIWDERYKMIFHAGVTLKETVVGIIISVIISIMIAILMDMFPNFKLAVYPILVISQNIPIIVLAPILIIYMGFGMASKILIVVLMCFFPITINFADGMSKVDKKLIDLIYLMGGSKIQTYSEVKIPGALPEFFSGVKVAATYSIIAAVVAEWLASSAGLGYYLLRLKNAYLLDRVFGCVVVIVLLSLFMNLIVKILEKILVKI